MWYVTDDESKANYGSEQPKMFITNSMKSSLYDYSVAYYLVQSDITIEGGNNYKSGIQKLLTV